MGLTPDLIQGAHHSYCKSRGTGPVPLCWPSQKGVFGTRRGSDRGSATRPAIPHAVAVTESKTRRFNERFSSRCELAHILVTPGQHKLPDAGFVQQRGTHSVRSQEAFMRTYYTARYAHQAIIVVAILLISFGVKMFFLSPPTSEANTHVVPSAGMRSEYRIQHGRAPWHPCNIPSLTLPSASLPCWE